MNYFINTRSIIFLIFLLEACGTNKSDEQQHTEVSSLPLETKAVFSDVDTTVKLQMGQIFQHYIHLKNALVANNFSEVKTGAQGIIGALEAIDTAKFTDDQKAAFDAQTGKIKENSIHIAETSEIAHQREHLNSLTSGIYNLLIAFGGNKTMYYDFCPMANDDEGGYWISELEEIKNPYFGNEMLDCGEIKKVIKGD